MKKIALFAALIVAACSASPAYASTAIDNQEQNLLLCRQATAKDGPGIAWLSARYDSMYSNPIDAELAMHQCLGYIYAQLEVVKFMQSK